ncbi:uncharacterized protein DUF4199 [Gillisia mitskevichiae]|uniref:Uncharacterized protein DUF4199 n=1 Tax=Gillisia mitskevichiae TaxID=270921 RepID=A0A495P3A5_9FLAO|nr:DUF4199 domain-containing protein [Gillisia mitskevichiae]RKS45104.1 uncharacterized protein DUF4199 [Gillisia mitskevichiae]
MNKVSIEIKWGVIFTLVTLLWMVFEKAMGWHDVLIAKHAIYTNFFGIIAVLIFILGLKDKKANFYNGNMTWRQGFVAGLIITIVITILSPLSQFISSTYITPDYFNNVIAYSVDSEVMTQEQAEAYFNLRSYIIQATFGALVMGVVTSAAVAWFLKTKEK